MTEQEIRAMLANVAEQTGDRQTHLALWHSDGEWLLSSGGQVHSAKSLEECCETVLAAVSRARDKARVDEQRLADILGIELPQVAA